MKSARRFWSSRAVRLVGGLAIVSAPAGVLLFGLMTTEGANPPADAARALSSAAVGAAESSILAKIDPAAVAGATACVECHKSEIAALEHSKHHDSIEKIKGTGGNIPKYAKAAGIAVGDVMKDSLCSRCHATPQGKGSSVQAISSVSCESCHGGSVGSPEWLKLHAVKETDRDERYAACDKAGMIRASNIYAIAKNCFECHVVADEALVNAGHPASNNIELVGWSTGEVRHNFQIDQKVNAEAPSLWLDYSGGSVQERRRLKYLTGLLVDLELSLKNLSVVGKDNGRKDFAKENAKRLKSTQKDLDKAIKALKNAAPAEAVAANKAIDDMGSVSSFNFKSQAEARKAAPIVAKAARTLAETADASKLGALDSVIESAVKPRGDVYSP